MAGDAPQPVKLFVAILWSDEEALERASSLLVERWGVLDFEGPDQVFDATGYYAEEMGALLRRRLVSFAALADPTELIEAKLGCVAIEEALRGDRGRRVNLDAGYLDHHKVVLASTKAAGQKIYLGRGVWADLVARYRKGRYHPFEWTFPDFEDGRYDEELAAIRARYREAVRRR